MPGGFVLVARMERIRRDGTPLPEPARWMKEGSPKLSLAELLGDLFFERPGYFRVIAFAVTDDLMPGEDPGARLPEPEEGAPTIPPELCRKTFRRPGGPRDHLLIRAPRQREGHSVERRRPLTEAAPEVGGRVGVLGWRFLIGWPLGKLRARALRPAVCGPSCAGAYRASHTMSA